MYRLENLLSEPEQEYLDFKQEFSDNNADFVHDILCLLNAESDCDRYLIFGVKDSSGEILGIENDTKRKNKQNITDMIRNANFNRIPTISMETYNINGHELDVLVLHNKKQRPYFLLKDFRVGKKTTRAGVIYTRDGDCNTPKNETANLAKIQDMWREHFGIDLTPFERFKLYLKEPDMWLRQPSTNDKSLFYYKQFPEFTIELKTAEDCEKNPCWYTYKPAIPYNVMLSYFNTTLDERLFYMLDKENCFFPFLDSSRYYVGEIFPEKILEIENARYWFENEFYFMLKDDLSYEIYNLFISLWNEKTIEEFASSFFAKVPIYVFKNLDEVKLKIKELGLGEIGVKAHIN